MSAEKNPVYEHAKKYYPEFWSDQQLDALVAAGRLTKKEADQIRKEAKSDE